MAEVDTSSYPKPPLPVSPFDIAKNYGGLVQQQQQIQSGQLTISTQKLQNAQTALTHMLDGLNSLGPNPTKDDIMKLGTNMVKMGLVPQNMMEAMESQVPNDPKFMPQFVDRLRTQAANHQEMLTYFGAQPNVTLDDGQVVKVLRVPQSPNYPVSIAAQAQHQLPPNTPVPNQQRGPNYGQPGYLGATGGQNPLPIAPAPSVIQPPQGNVAPIGPTLKDQGRVPQNGGAPNGFVPSGMPPLYNQGLEKFNNDQQATAARLSAIKPAILALDKMKGLTTGPGTEKFNEIMGLLKNIGFVPTKDNDPVAAYQEANKYLAQYLGQTPFRSDAEQQMRASGTPNAHIQINQALQNLTRESIMLDRLNALQTLSFTNKDNSPRNDFENYGDYKSKFAQTIDHHALGLDLLEPNDRKSLLDDMKKKAKTPEGQKFWHSLQVIHDTNLFGY